VIIYFKKYSFSQHKRNVSECNITRTNMFLSKDSRISSHSHRLKQFLDVVSRADFVIQRIESVEGEVVGLYHVILNTRITYEFL